MTNWLPEAYHARGKGPSEIPGEIERFSKEVLLMKSRLGLALFLLTALVPLKSVGQANVVALFKGGIGVDPVSNVTVSGGTTTVSPNTVRGVPPAGQIWVISDLEAGISSDGSILVIGRGLLLGGGNAIGMSGGQTVFATLFCGPAGFQTSVSSSSLAGVPLDAAGNFTINDVLSPVPSNPCTTPVLLIRSVAGNGNNNPWFAAGIPFAP
jgi:hypothetical protein